MLPSGDQLGASFCREFSVNCMGGLPSNPITRILIPDLFIAE
jgi:hypothetical protein